MTNSLFQEDVLKTLVTTYHTDFLLNIIETLNVATIILRVLLCYTCCINRTSPFLAFVDRYRVTWSFGMRRALRGFGPHQIKHLNNYCLICCGGRRACGLIMTRLDKESVIHSLFSSYCQPIGPSGNSNHITDFTEKEPVIVKQNQLRVQSQELNDIHYVVSDKEIKMI